MRKTRQCVIAIPSVDLLDKVVGIGTCSGAETDKFARFHLTPVRASRVKAPLIKECLANIECRVTDIVGRHNIVVLEGLAAYVDATRKEKRTLHAVGDGSFGVDGRRPGDEQDLVVRGEWRHLQGDTRRGRARDDLVALADEVGRGGDRGGPARGGRACAAPRSSPASARTTWRC